MVSDIFVNIAVKDLDKSMAFFRKLGWKFNPQFTDRNAACLVIGKNIYSMLLTKKFVKRFTKKKLINPKKEVEAMLSLSVGSKREVDALLAKAIAAGGRPSEYNEDLGYMYGKGFQDPDGHIWEIFWMDPKHIQK